jgi:hypothetical protein
MRLKFKEDLLLLDGIQAIIIILGGKNVIMKNVIMTNTHINKAT